MASSASSSSISSLSSLPSLSSSSFPNNPRLAQPAKSNSRACTKIHAARREAHHNHNSPGRLVDENMIVLRQRIHEIKMTETIDEPPREWMEWEKEIYSSYDSMICDAMGHLQTYLMETRPSLALGMVALIALSVPTSTAVAAFKFLELANAVLNGIHLN